MDCPFSASMAQTTLRLMQESSRAVQIEMIVNHNDGTSDEIMLNHTFNEQQIGWFKSGSALNHMSSKK